MQIIHSCSQITDRNLHSFSQSAIYAILDRLWQVCYAIKLTFAIANKHFIIYTSFHKSDKRLFIMSAYSYLSTLYVSSVRVKELSRRTYFFKIFMTACGTSPTSTAWKISSYLLLIINLLQLHLSPFSITMFASGTGLLLLLV